jgi:hypothetical protein
MRPAGNRSSSGSAQPASIRWVMHFYIASHPHPRGERLRDGRFGGLHEQVTGYRV